jgi:hypothetical protein
MAKLDSATSDFVQLRLLEHPSPKKRVIVTGVDYTLYDATSLSQELSSLLLRFTGAEIDFSTGGIFEDDGTTPLGIDFTPTTITANEYLWYSVGLVFSSADTDGAALGQILVTPASGSGATPLLAPKAVFGGEKKLGAVVVQDDGGAGVGTILDIAQADVVQLAGTGGSASSVGGGINDPASGFQIAIEDTFDVLATSTDSKVRAVETNGLRNIVNELYELKCDKSPTLTTVGTAYTLSGAPSFTLAVGDIIWDDAQATWRRVASVATTTTGTIDVAFTVDLSAAAGMVSQTVTTKDLVNAGDATELTRPRDFCPSTPVSIVHIDYFDSLAVNDSVADFNATANIVVSAANDGTQATSGLPTSDLFFDIFTRPSGKGQIENYPLAEIAGDERLFLTFFCNPNNGSVTAQANVLAYRVSFYDEESVTNGGFLDSAFCMTDGTGTPVNCSNPSIVGGVTQVELDFHFTTGIEAGRPDGDLEVYLDGNAIPRKFTGVVVAFWEEVPGSTNKIKLDANYSGSAFGVQVRRRQGAIVNDANRDILRQETKVATFTATATKDIYFVDGTSGAFTADLPTAAGNQGKVYYFKRTDNTPANPVTIDPSGVETIDGVTTLDLINQYAVLQITSDGLNWSVLGRNLV